MSNLSYRIPRYADADVAFLGVELQDTWLFILSVFIALIVGGFMGGGTVAFLGIPLGGYFVNRAFIEWKSQYLPGFVRTYLFSRGISGYGAGMNTQQVVYVGDAVAINPGSAQFLDAWMAKNKPCRGAQYGA